MPSTPLSGIVVVIVSTSSSILLATGFHFENCRIVPAASLNAHALWGIIVARGCATRGDNAARETRQVMMRQLLAAAILLAATQASAKNIEAACLKSDRPSASRQLCGCIQDVANLTLDKGEQRRAADFFADPHKAQEVRRSASSADRTFWKRYSLFAKSAGYYCR